MARSNPETSLEGWEKALEGSVTVKHRVHAILRGHGPLTLDALCDEYRRYRSLYGWNVASEASIRSRCADLAHERPARVESIPGKTGTSRYGRAATLWRAVSV